MAEPDREVLRLSRRIRRLEETLGQVESIRDTNMRLLDRLMADLAAERARSRELLLNVLPEGIVARLDAGETRIADRHERVAVLFSDLVGFTGIAARLAPAELVAELDELFSAFDAACAAQSVEKIKTIGDAYMAAAGLSPSEVDPCAASAAVGLEMLRAVEASRGGWRIRIGLHVGPVVAGVIGRHKFAYDLWGDSVNVASRLEATAEPGRIHVSAEVADALRGRYRFEPRGPIELKGMGSVETFYLLPPT
jgi:adenylate cyclase